MCLCCIQLETVIKEAIRLLMWRDALKSVMVRPLIGDKCYRINLRRPTTEASGLCGLTVERSLAILKVAGSNLGRSASW